MRRLHHTESIRNLPLGRLNFRQNTIVTWLHHNVPALIFKLSPRTAREFLKARVRTMVFKQKQCINGLLVKQVTACMNCEPDGAGNGGVG